MGVFPISRGVSSSHSLVEGGLGALAVVLGLVFGLPVPEWVQLGELEVGLGILATLSLFGFCSSSGTFRRPRRASCAG